MKHGYMLVLAVLLGCSSTAEISPSRFADDGGAGSAAGGGSSGAAVGGSGGQPSSGSGGTIGGGSGNGAVSGTGGETVGGTTSGGTGGVCQPSTKSCYDIGKELSGFDPNDVGFDPAEACGDVDDGCGGTIRCGGCSHGTCGSEVNKIAQNYLNSGYDARYGVSLDYFHTVEKPVSNKNICGNLCKKYLPTNDPNNPCPANTRMITCEGAIGSQPKLNGVDICTQAPGTSGIPIYFCCPESLEVLYTVPESKWKRTEK